MIDPQALHRDRARWRERWYAEGYFSRDPIRRLIDEAVRRAPDTELHYYRSGESTGDARGLRTTASAMLGESHRVAGALYEAGVRAGDTVAVQLPTWHETTLVYLALLQLGALVLPIVHLYGPRELSFILEQSRATTLLIPDRWRGIDYIDRLARAAPGPALQRVIVLGEHAPPGMLHWEELLRHAGAPFPASGQDPDAACVLIYTSGTSAAPKGVLFSHNNLRAEWTSPFFTTGGPYLCNFPAGHIAGFNFVLRPLVTATPMVYFDHWDAILAARLVERHRVSESGGTGFFLKELLRAAASERCDLDSLRFYSLGGTGVTPAEVLLAEQHGIRAGRVYGSTEHSTVTAVPADASIEQRSRSDGHPVRGNRVRVVDDEGGDVPRGAQGEILSQGPELFMGYTDPEHDHSGFAEGGWFRTGDMGFLDADGYLTLTDRKKDIIIRGGENISSKEIEEILATHPAVLESAVVAMPDERYGERICAFVRLRPGATLKLAELAPFFAAAGAARQKTPERLVLVDDFPRTPSSKVRKVELRARLRCELAPTPPS